MRRRELDWPLLLAALALAGIGIAALSSATGAQAVYAHRQVLWVLLGIPALLIALAVSEQAWAEAAPALYALSAGSLLVVLMFGRRVNGSKSWLSAGPFNFQPSEFMKLATILLVARVLSRNTAATAGPGLIAQVAVVGGIPIALVLMQPDMGTAVSFAAVLGLALVVAGLGRRTWALALCAGLAAGALGWTYVLKDYQRARILTFFRPETDPLATGYQIIQSRIAIGSGGLLGKGFAACTQSQLNFIPEKHTDFVFPVVAEEWGFLGSLAVLLLYGFVLARGLAIAGQARDGFGSYLVLGIMALIATHVLINLGMVTGLLPTIGIPLPLMSYGGSSMVTMMAGIGLVLNVRMRRSING